ncbi:centlein isoform X2 [Salminus brasiliensis]|uniref:centlein isoform X2 n=1 Tax=Salminus brasiliensis TaxID=930266 RepID=UPI003B838C6C
MESKERERVLLLEEEVKSLSEELIQCQADKEFVWSLWKRLQVANPDLTQAVSLVVEREKQKAEAKDRKVLEILQAKDYKIQELEKDVTAQRQELGSLGQRQREAEEQRGLMKKELAGLRHKLANKSRQLQELEECKRASEDRERCVQSEVEEVRRSLQERCSVLQQELLAERQNSNRQEETHTARVQELQGELVSSRAKLLEVQGRSAALSSQLSTVEQQASERERQLQQLRQELAELQALYKQSVAHAGEQAELIQQLEGLNLDTQHVLRSQEQAHCTHTASYQKLYSELTVSYQALLSREEELRQRDTALTAQLRQRDQQVSQLQAELHQLQLHQQQQQQRDRTSKAVVQQQCPEPPASTPIPQSQPEEDMGGNEPPAQPPASGTQSSSTEELHAERESCSRSLPAGSRSSAEAERRIQQLEELLSLKTQENEELRRAHAKRHQRLHLIQTNYRAVKEQLREAEDVQGLPKGRRKRAEPWQLRQENSDAVWNELSFFKRENKKLLSEKAHLEEELDVARVQAAMDRATAQELRVRLQEQQELQLRGDGKEAVSSTLILPSAQRLDKSIKKIEVLERKMVCLERETEQLRDDNHALQEAGEMLSRERSDLQAALKRATAREEAELERLRAQLLGEVQALEARLQSSRREAAEARRAEAQARHSLLRLRQELGVLRAERDFHRAATRRWSKTTTRLPATRPRGLTQARTHSERQRRTHTLSEQQRTRSPAKDEWEDMSPDSETEEFSDSLESQRPARTRRNPSEAKGCRYGLIAPRVELRDDFTTDQPQRAPGPVRRDLRKPKRMQSNALHQRLLCLQQQVAVLQSASRAATRTAQDQTEKHTQAQMELETLTHRLQASKQLSQKQACELVALQQQRAVLEMELEQWRKSCSPSQERFQPTVTPDPSHPTCTTPSSAPDPNQPTLKQLETDIKQLNSKLKSATSEVNKQSTVIKGLRTELHERDQRLKELQDKLSHAERDVVMKRQLVEDLRSRMKVLQDSESSRRSLIDDLEKKVKTLSEEASNRKAFIESLKRRLSVATQEKSQCESSSQKLREDLQKRDQKLAALQVRLAECERSRAELEEKVCVQAQAVSQQHSDALQMLQNKLGLAQCQHEQLRSFTQALVVELSQEVQETRVELRKRRRERKRRDKADRGVSKSSMQKAQSIAASILNLTQTDLASILDTDEEEECDRGGGEDWMDRVRQILQQQVPSAALLVEAVLEKLKEFRLLTEELAVFTSTVSETA